MPTHPILKQTGVHIRKSRNLLKDKIAKLTINTSQPLSAQMMPTVIVTKKTLELYKIKKKRPTGMWNTLIRER